MSMGRFRPSNRAAWRLNQTISFWLLKMMTPSGRAAVERRSSRYSCTRRCLWYCLRRCNRTTWLITSPQIPPRLGASICERSRSQRSSLCRFTSCQPRYRHAAANSQSQTGPKNRPSIKPASKMPASRASAKVHIDAMGWRLTPLEVSRACWASHALGIPSREPVAGSAYRLHQPLQKIRLERLTQPANVHVHRTFLHVSIPAPYPVEQLAPREDALGMGHEEMQQAVFR